MLSTCLDTQSAPVNSDTTGCGFSEKNPADSDSFSYLYTVKHPMKYEYQPQGGTDYKRALSEFIHYGNHLVNLVATAYETAGTHRAVVAFHGFFHGFQIHADFLG